MAKAPTTFARFLPPPVRGVDITKPFISGIPDTALEIDNFICRPEGLIVPPGPNTPNLAVGNPRVIIPGPTVGSYFLTRDDGIYSSAGANLTALTKALGWHVSFSTGAGNFIFFCNAADTPKYYSSVTSLWANWAFVGPATPSTMLQPTSYRKRMYFADSGKLSIWYGGPDSISGTLTEYNLGSIFKRRGFVNAIQPMSMDGGLGPDDLLAVFSTSGEFVLLSGSDPSSVDWQVLGVFEAGPPGCGATPATVNPNFVCKLGGDLIVLTQNGVQSLTQLIRGKDPGVAQTLSWQIDPAIRYLYSSGTITNNTGSYLCLLRSQNLLMVFVNTLYSGGVAYGPYVMDLRTGAWSRFAFSVGAYGGYLGWCELQFSGNTQIWAIDTNGARQVFYGGGGAIMPGSWMIRYPYARMGLMDPFRVVQARPLVWAGPPISASFGFVHGVCYDMLGDYRFENPTAYGGATNNYAPADALYGIMTNNVSSVINRAWATLPGHNGYCVSYMINHSNFGTALSGELRFLGVDLRMEQVEIGNP